MDFLNSIGTLTISSAITLFAIKINNRLMLKQNYNNSNNKFKNCSITYNDSTKKEEILNEVKYIISENFNNNIQQLVSMAREEVNKRAIELQMDLIKQVSEFSEERFVKFIELFKTPAYQYSLMEAQKTYAIYGDIDKKNILIDLLLKKTEEENETLTDIGINIAIETIKKLTKKQIDLMSLFYVVYWSFSKNGTEEDFKDFALKTIKPFLKVVPINANNAKHLEELNLLQFYTNKFLSPYQVLITNHKLQNISIDSLKHLMSSWDEEFKKLDILENTQGFKITQIAEIICRSNVSAITGIDLPIRIDE